MASELTPHDDWQGIPEESKNLLMGLTALCNAPQSVVLLAYQLGCTDGIIKGMQAGRSEALQDSFRRSVAATEVNRG